MTPAQNLNLVIYHEARKILLDCQNIASIDPELTTPVAIVASEQLTVFSDSGKMLEFSENPIDKVVDLLFEKGQAEAAISLVKEKRSESQDSSLNELFVQTTLRYGDQLYEAGNYSLALQQYKQTIGLVEMSYVIQKFVDFTKLPHLIDYLEAVISTPYVTSKQILLLALCYIKLEKDEHIDQLVDKVPLDFKDDVEECVHQFIRFGYVKQALALCRKVGKHQLYIETILQQTSDLSSATEYLSHCPNDILFEILKTHGSTLCSHAPKQILDLALRLIEDQEFVHRYEELEHILIRHPELEMTYLENALKSGWNIDFEKEEVRFEEPGPHAGKLRNLCQNLLDLYLNSTDREKSFSVRILTKLLNLIVLESIESPQASPGRLRCIFCTVPMPK